MTDQRSAASGRDCTCTIACIPQGKTDEQTCRLRDDNADRDTQTLIFEREQWNRLYHEQGRKMVALEAALGGLVDLAERLGQGIPPADPALVAARVLLGRDA